MGLEVETATKFPHKLQREKKRKKRKDKKKGLPFLQPAPLADDKNLDTSRPYNLYPLHADPRSVYYVYVLQK